MMACVLLSRPAKIALSVFKHLESVLNVDHSHDCLQMCHVLVTGRRMIGPVRAQL